jgi:hypothetical protein
MTRKTCRQNRLLHRDPLDTNSSLSSGGRPDSLTGKTCELEHCTTHVTDLRMLRKFPVAWKSWAEGVQSTGTSPPRVGSLRSPTLGYLLQPLQHPVVPAECFVTGNSAPFLAPWTKLWRFPFDQS